MIKTAVASSLMLFGALSVSLADVESDTLHNNTVDITDSCPFRQQLMSKIQDPQRKLRKFIALQKASPEMDRGFGHELLTVDAFGHEMLTCSAQ